MNRIFLVLFELTVILGCKKSESPITIVDIALINRIELGKQLRVINKYSPKIIVLDFFLNNDSLSIDSILVKELAKSNNTVQCTAVHNFNEHLNYWDSLEVSHSKFKVTHNGFSNITITDDSVFVPKLPMRQFYRTNMVMSLSYAVAHNSFGVKEKYQGNDGRDFIFDLNNITKDFKLIRASELTSGNFKREDLKGKIVIMGYVGKNEDSFYLDRRRTKKISGAEIQACIIRQIIKLE
jgi:CHASE2 domain-containing sensor protein